jgi:hypothetical protein
MWRCSIGWRGWGVRRGWRTRDSGRCGYHDITLGDLLESVVLHAFDGKTPFSAASLGRIEELKRFYGLELDSSASHKLKETGRKARPAR